ncbi:hypothetical protein B0A55_08607 [Friedmanniomyces simplex]|uniref:Protein kinase domain-containing protein n=1 Tax=Friedmanniomyces simplex TaxID=329884 RepID=A0A4U0WX23_9PEZI|nr:hypothetical protein B0A55_08607 [Friedmanniomyces simplex]
MSARLGKLGQWKLHLEASVPSPRWRAPEGETDTIAGRRKTDIWQLGIVIAQMFLGLHIIDEHQSPEVMLGRLDLSESFEDLLRKAFTPDPKRRASAFDLLPAEFLRTNAEVLDVVSMQPTHDRRRPSSSMMSAKRRSRHNSSNVAEPISRYAMDFTEMGRLGKGGFGEVVKARNKLDGGIYAVKRVKQSPQLLDQVLSEVMLLNRLNHPYVVRYFSTWVEDDFSGGIVEDATTTTDETADDATEETTSEGPRMDFGFSSAGGLDFVSSSGYPQIEFGDDDSENEAEAADDNGPAVDSAETSERGDPGIMRPRSGSQKPPSILYIQMEYCERHTLRDLVRKGMTTDESWRYVRQITEGLAHIHSHGIIHRDLKPDNIFIDLAGNPKIGDFGLATTSQYHSIERSATMSGHSGGEMTRSVGTTLYVAPELRSSAGGAYNDKVDMYSLGIMFYEMCEMFGTAMERIRALQQIREKQYELPSTYRANGEKAAQGKLIACLISHKPGERPSSTELLRSDVLPVKIEDETIRQALSGLTDPRSPYHQKMMSALFAHDSASNSRVKALAWDAKGTGVADSASRLRYRSIAMQAMLAVFRRHGAEEVRRDTLFPRSGYYTNANVVQLLDASGNLLQMPYDLTLPHARQLAKNTPAVKRSFTFGSAYRDAFTTGAPKVSDEVDFDIAQVSLSEESSLDDAETLKVMDEIVCAMPSFSNATSVSLHLNHTTILDAILDYCRVPLAQQATVKETISKLGFHQWTWSKVRAELRKFGLPDTSLDDLQQFDFRDTADKAFARLRALMETANARILAKLEEGVRLLQDVVRATSHFALQLKVYIAPLGSVNARLYEGGMLFQCVLERKSNRTVIAAGGRYDSLIHAHRAMTATKPCEGAVGVSIGLDAIVAHVARNRGEGSKKAFLKNPMPVEALPRRCDVLVEAGPTDGSTAAGLRLLASLWASDLSAELATGSRATAEFFEYSFVVTVRHEASNSVRVSNTARETDEVDVPVTSLVGYLQQELREREASKVRPPSFIRQASSHHDSDRKGNVQVLMSQHRSKKSNKYHIVEAAQQQWAEKVDEWKDAPILAVETSDNVLDSVRGTRLGDAESWRKAVQACQLNERQYLGQVQEILGSWRKKWVEEGGPREACIFNFRTGNCIYYDVGLLSKAAYVKPAGVRELCVDQLILPHGNFHFGRKNLQDAFGIEDKTISTHHLHFHCVVYEEADGEQGPGVAPLVYVRTLSANPVFLSPSGSNNPSDSSLLGKDSGDVLLNHGDLLQLTPTISIQFRAELRKQSGLDSIRQEEFKRFSSQFSVIDRVLGSGGHSSVFVAVKRSTRRQVACKVVRVPVLTVVAPQADLEAAAKAKAVERLLRKQRSDLAREYEVLKDLSHPNIISLEKVFCTTHSVYIFQELITGGDLLSSVDRRDALSEPEAAVIIRQVLKAVEYLHSNQIVHRDIKPENVMMTSWRQGARVVLTDFGQARMLGDDIAPEVFGQLRRDRPKGQGYSKAIDIWSHEWFTHRHYAAELEGAYQRAIQDWKPRTVNGSLVQFIDTSDLVLPEMEETRPAQETKSHYFPAQDGHAEDKNPPNVMSNYVHLPPPIPKRTANQAFGTTSDPLRQYSSSQPGTQSDLFSSPVCVPNTPPRMSRAAETLPNSLVENAVPPEVEFTLDYTMPSPPPYTQEWQGNATQSQSAFDEPSPFESGRDASIDCGEELPSELRPITTLTHAEEQYAEMTQYTGDLDAPYLP